MNLTTTLRQFTAHGIAKRLDLSGDKHRFFSLRTAKAWTAWLGKAKKGGH
jgi:hypothetical protein